MSYKEALGILFDNTSIETINHSVQTPDYWEFYGESGGDILRYRVYQDGSIYAK